MTTICSVQSCDAPMTEKSARGMCPRHYSSWRRIGSAVKPCAGCGEALESNFAKYCSESCKPRCSVEGCGGAVRKRGWCGSHYAQQAKSGSEPIPFQYKWQNVAPCANCGTTHDGTAHRIYCSTACRAAYRLYGGPRPTSTNCVACGVAIDLTERGKKGQRRHAAVKFCRPCKRDYAKYKLSVRELAQRDGTDCGICSRTVDMTLTRADGLECPSVDHIVPRSHGGTHDPENLQLAHLRCNMVKSDRVTGVMTA